MATPGKKEEGKKYTTAIFSRRSASSVHPVESADISGEATPVPTEFEKDLRKDRKFKHKKHSRWYRLRRRLTRKGVVPVNRNHPRYHLLSSIREGIHELSRQYPEVKPKDALSEADLTEVLKINSAFDGQAFEFESFASSAFATIRQAVGITEEEYNKSIAPGNLPYLEFMSNSKSGQDFFLSNDMQYMFKSNRKRDVDFFLSILSNYMQHFITYPHSLIVKYIGCFSIKFKGESKRYFLVMQSIFFPADRIEDRFDVKGCTAGRYQKPNPPGSHIITVLKDQNFFNEELDFGTQGDWFISQIRADAEFLRSHNCMDYSLLVGRQQLHISEKGTEPIATLVTRIDKSLSPTKQTFMTNFSAAENEISTYLPSLEGEGDGEHQMWTTDIDSVHEEFTPKNSINSKTDGQSSGKAVSETKEQSIQNGSKVIAPSGSRESQGSPKVVFPQRLGLSVERFQDENRRLLPDCTNALHIIEGSEFRYFVGIVDFLTRFDWRQKSAQYWKMIKYGCGDHSTKHPNIYSRRFVDFLSKRVR